MCVSSFLCSFFGVVANWGGKVDSAVSFIYFFSGAQSISLLYSNYTFKAFRGLENIRLIVLWCNLPIGFVVLSCCLMLT